MRIQTNGNYVDFEAPIYMEQENLDKLVSFLKHLTGEEIIVREVKEKERFNSSEKVPGKSKPWKAEEFYELLTNTDNMIIAEKLERSEMSVAMQRANFVPSFISWAKEKGFESDKISKTLIEEFLQGEKDDRNL